MPRTCLHSRRSGLILLILAAAQLTGCAGSGSRKTGPAASPRVPDQWPGSTAALSTVRLGCDVLPGDAQPGGDFVFALTEEVRPDDAPVPHNESERVVFSQLYETLLNVACDGTLTAGLATNWTCTADSTTWVFTLREDARFWDGTRVTAEDVRQSWAHNQVAEATLGAASPWHWINAQAASITAVDARRLAIQLPEPQARFPLLLAHPAAAVAIRQPGWTWPVGSGPARLRASDPAPRPDLACRPNPSHPDQPIWRSLVFRVTPQTDLRDLLTSAVDLALTRQLAAVRFFDEAPGFQTAPLPWDRLYLLVCPPLMNPDGNATWTAAVADLRPNSDVTAVAARSWDHITFPAGQSADCPQLSGPITNRQAAPVSSGLANQPLGPHTVAYGDGDPAAAELAARLSHLAGNGVQVAPLRSDDLGLALQWQMTGAVVLSQEQLFPTACLQLASLLGRAVWLQHAALVRAAPEPAETLVQADELAARAACDPVRALRREGLVQPLALSHRWLITRGSLAGVHLDFDGTPRLSGLGRLVAP